MITTKLEQSKGILHPKPGAQKFQLARLLPSPDLSFFIECYWIVSWDLRGQGPYVQETLPFPCVHAVFEQDASQIVGVDTGKFSRLLEGKGRVFGIKFKPGAFYPFIKKPVSQFTDGFLSFQLAFKMPDATLLALEKEILSLTDETAMQEIAERFLREKLPKEDENVRGINRIVDYIHAHREISKVDDLVSELRLNKRSLQRLFNLYVGVSPKWVIRRFRLQEVAEQLSSGEVEDWARMALELGYFDQAHFIKDFKALIGRTPADYLKEQST
jgi:AraC-like DNA-binding protein